LSLFVKAYTDKVHPTSSCKTFNPCINPAVRETDSAAASRSRSVVLQVGSDSSPVSNGSKAPSHLPHYCVPAAGADTRLHLRSINSQLLAVPRYMLNTCGLRTFSVAGPTVWNSLPDFIRDPTISADCFRRLFKTYLFARYQCIQRARGS